MMKPLTSAILLRFAMLIVLCACGDKEEKKADAGPDPILGNGEKTDAGPEEDAQTDQSDAAEEDAESAEADSAMQDDADTQEDADTENQAPTAEPLSISTDEDESAEITLQGTDPDGDSITYTVHREPTKGNLSGKAPNLSYTPDSNFNGEDSFTYSVSDGDLESDTVEVTITVRSVNDAPVAEPQTITGKEDAVLSITLSARDVDEDSLDYEIQDHPKNGTLSGSGANWDYLPDSNFNGSDSFTFTVDDGTSESDIATVSIDLAAVNDPPVAEPQEVTVEEDVATLIMLVATDVDADPLNYTIQTDPENGSLNGSGNEWIYHPDDDFNGSDSFSFSVDDGELESDTVTVSIFVTPVNDPPTAAPQAVTTEEDTSVTITLSATDVDADPLSYAIQALPEFGVLSGSANQWSYDPDDNFNGSDSFTFKVNDGEFDSATVTVTISVTPVNDPPVAESLELTVDEDNSLEITLGGSDVDLDALTFVIRDNPDEGTLSGSGSARIYLPNPNFNGSDSFTYIVNDGSENSAEATVSITVLPVNDKPLAHAQRVKTEVNTPVDFTLVGTDAEGSQLSYTIVTPPDRGTLSGTAPDLTYTPDTDFKGRDELTFLVNDSQLDSDVAVVTFIVGHRPNILLIIGDDMGIETTTDNYPGLIDALLEIYDNSAIDGNSAYTPTIRDRIFEEGVIFDNMWGQQTCSPMRASTFTGLFGNKTNVGYASTDLTPHQINMAQLLYNSGYRTGMFGKWHLGQDNDPSKPCDVGFEVFKGNLQGGIPNYWDYNYQVQSIDAEGNPTALINSEPPEVTIPINGTDVVTTYAPAVKVTDTIDWISSKEAEDPDTPWFAWLAFNAPHTPLHEPEDVFLDPIAQAELHACRPYCSDAQLLRSMINAMDTVLGVLLDEVEALDTNTVVIFVGDNGTVRTSIDNMYLTTAGRGKTTNYESGVRIPFAVRGPMVQHGAVSNEFVHVVDLFATVLEFAGLQPPTMNYAYYDKNIEVESDSVSLVPILEGTKAAVRDPVFDYILSEKFGFGTSAAARNGTYKIICNDYVCSNHSFYNLIEDPLEEYPLDTAAITCPVEATPTQDSMEENFCRLREVILTESYYSR